MLTGPCQSFDVLKGRSWYHGFVIVFDYGFAFAVLFVDGAGDCLNYV